MLVFYNSFDIFSYSIWSSFKSIFISTLLMLPSKYSLSKSDIFKTKDCIVNYKIIITS